MHTQNDKELTCAWRTVIDARGNRRLVAIWAPKNEASAVSQVA